MDTIDLDREWEVIERLLPEGWKALAQERLAIRRDRGVTDPAVLLRLMLMHVGTGLSLRSTVARASQQKLASMSAVGLLKRLRTSEQWLAALTCRLFARTRFGNKVAQVPSTNRLLRVVDATTVQQPGSTETDWRVHYSVGLWDLRCDHFQITNSGGGETFKRFPVRRGDILMGDRGYCHREGVANVVRRGGDVIVRLNRNTFPLLELDGEPFDILGRLRTLDGLRPGSWPVEFEWKKKKYPGRLCAIRLTTEAAEKAKARLLKRDKKKNGKGQRVMKETLESAEYMYILTTVGEQELTAGQVLELYRLRWQIELVFKRLKSLLRLSELPKRTDSSSRAWLQGKLLVALLIERLVENAKIFSPWGHDLHSA
jgi:hypothetical protein